MRLGLVLVGATAAVAVAACTTDYQQGLDDPKYGGPNILADQKPPGASIDQNAGGSSSSGGVAGPKCGTPVALPAGCTVKFADVLAVLKPAACGAAPPCHGAGGTEPIINFDSSDATWVNLTNYSAQGGKFYVNPCSVDPAQSKIVANLDPASPDRGTVMPPTVGIKDAATLAKVKEWVTCGSPK